VRKVLLLTFEFDIEMLLWIASSFSVGVENTPWTAFSAKQHRRYGKYFVDNYFGVKNTPPRSSTEGKDDIVSRVFAPHP
jgi:hypothetical protein